MRAWLHRLIFCQSSQFIYSARRAVFADGEVRDIENGSQVVRHAWERPRR